MSDTPTEQLETEEAMFVQTAQGSVPPQTGPITLFIDPFGRRLSPVSVCGVRRRARRRL